MCDYTNPEVEPLGLQHTYLSLSGSREVPTKRHKKTTEKRREKRAPKKQKKTTKKDKQIKNLLMIQQKEIDYLFLLIPPVCM